MLILVAIFCEYYLSIQKQDNMNYFRKKTDQTLPSSQSAEYTHEKIGPCIGDIKIIQNINTKSVIPFCSISSWTFETFSFMLFTTSIVLSIYKRKKINYMYI